MARLAESEVENAVVSDPLTAMRQALVEGKDVEAAVYGHSSGNDNPSVIGEDNDESSNETAAVEESGNLVDSATPEQLIADMEELWVKDESGRRQKIEVNYKDRESIKKAYLKAVGMRKFQAERDNERRAKAELQKKLDELSGNFSELERAYKEGGARGVFERLGGDGAWEKAVAAELAHREKLAGMSEAERVALEYDQKLKRAEAEKNAVLTQFQKEKAEAEARKTEAAEKALYSRLTPSFEKHRFYGKLGDEAAEHRLDKAIWSEVTERLAEYPEDVELTNAVIDKEFRAVASSYSKFLNKQVADKAKQTINNQKAVAAEKAQLVVKKNLTANKLDQSVEKDIQNNDWSSLLQKVMFSNNKKR